MLVPAEYSFGVEAFYDQLNTHIRQTESPPVSTETTTYDGQHP